MHVLFVNSARGRGGGLTSSLELGRGLAGRGHTVTMVCHPKSELRARLEDDDRIRVACVAIRAEINPLRVVQLARLHGRLAPDVVLADRRKDVKLSVAARDLARRELPIVHRHGAPSTLKDSVLYRLVWGRIQGLVVNSETMRALLMERAPWLRRLPIHTIPNGKDCHRYRPRPELRGPGRDRLGIPDDAVVATYVGTFEPRKNVHLLLEALARIDGAVPVHALIVGGGRLKEDLRERARRLGVSATFTGFRSDVPELLAVSDVAVHLSTAEGFSNSVLEAMACELPVIASDATSHPEQIDHGIHGLLVEPRRAEPVADALRTLATDAALRRRMGRNARERVVAEYDRATMVERYENVLASVRSGRLPGPDGAAAEAREGRTA